MHAHLQTLPAAVTVSMTPLVASVVGTFILLALLAGIERALPQFARFDNWVSLAVMVIGFGGYLAQTNFIPAVGTGIKNAIAAATKDVHWYGVNVYDILLYSLIAWLLYRLYRTTLAETPEGRRGRIWYIIFLIALIVPFFLSGFGKQISDWYISAVGEGVTINFVRLLAWIPAHL